MRSENVYFAFGESHTLTEWGEIYNISPQGIRKRLKRGMTIEEALTIRKKHEGINSNGEGYKFGKEPKKYHYVDHGRNYIDDVKYFESLEEVKKGLGIKDEFRE